MKNYINRKANENRWNNNLINEAYSYGLLALEMRGITEQFQVDRILTDVIGWNALLITISPEYFVHYYPHDDTFYLFYENKMDSFTTWGDLMEFLDSELSQQSDVGYIEIHESSNV